MGSHDLIAARDTKPDLQLCWQVHCTIARGTTTPCQLRNMFGAHIRNFYNVAVSIGVDTVQMM